MRYVNRHFRLTNEPGGLGLSCTSAGLSLAGVPLLRSTEAGFAPRPTDEIESLIGAACGKTIDQTALSRSLKAIAVALNRGDLGYAMTAAVLTRLPELDWDGAARLAKAEERLRLAKYDADQPRDQRGRWTTGGGGRHSGEVGTSPAAMRGPANENGGASAPRSQNGRDQGFTPLSADDLPAPLTVHPIAELESPFADLERKYDELGPAELADQAIRFGDQLGRHGKDLSPDEQKAALREYEFLQSRVSFWQTYDGPMPPEAAANITSAALTLFQGAVLGGIVTPDSLPFSYLAAAALAPPAADTSSIGGRHPNIEEGFEGEAALPVQGRSEPVEDAEPPLETGQTPKESEGASSPGDGDLPATDAGRVGLGGFVSAKEAGIDWDGGIDTQGLRVEDYSVANTPGATKLEANSKTFDATVAATGEAISVKTLNPLCYSYAANPRRVFWTVKRYINSVIYYKGGKSSRDLDPDDIVTTSLHLYIRDYMSPAQKMYLEKAIDYGRLKRNSFSVVVTRVTDE
jgi:hypothetical protein